MKYKAIIIASVLTTLTSCQDSLFDIECVDPKQVSFAISLVQEYPQEEVQTRGTPQSGLSAYENRKIKVIGIDTSEGADGNLNIVSKLYKRADRWLLDPNRAYDERSYDFYAIGSDLDSISTTENNNGLMIDRYAANGKIVYTVPEEVINQPDLIVAEVMEHNTTGEVKLTMYHALSCVGVVATSQHQGRKIHSFTVKEVYRKGYMEIAKKAGNPVAWTTEPSSATGITFASRTNDHPLGINRPENLEQYMNGNGYLMMIPQELPEGALIEVTLWDGATETSKSIITYKIPPTKWEPGKKYIYYFDEPILKGIATYYEHYSSGEYGLYYYDNLNGDLVDDLKNTLQSDQEILDAGYGLLAPVHLFTKYPSIYLGLEDNTSVSKTLSASKGNVVAKLKAFSGTPLDCILYSVSQSNYPYKRTAESRKGLQPYKGINSVKAIEAGASETGSGKPIHTHGYVMSNYAKGVFRTQMSPAPSTHYIRTPIQMRNISYQASLNNTYIQELETLDFSFRNNKKSLGNDITAHFEESIVIGAFGGTYDGSNMRIGIKAKIAGLLIQTTANNSNTGLFELVDSIGRVSNLEMKPSCIFINSIGNTSRYIGAFAAENRGTLFNLFNYSSITNYSESTNVGGIVGINQGVVKRCENYGGISSQAAQEGNMTGGIVGWNEKNYGNWRNLDATLQATFRKHQYGDFDGNESFPAALVIDCQNNGKITGGAYIGGIAGYSNYGGILYRCINKGEVSNNSLRTARVYLGGIVGIQQCGENNNPKTNPGGGNPPMFFTLTQECINEGRVTLRSGVLGEGLLGVGGIVGCNDFASGTDGIDSPYDGFLPVTYSKINRCVVRNTTITGRNSDTGGVAGINNGSVNRSVCSEVYVLGVFSQGDDLKRNSAGGIVGCNTNYVGDCLFIHSAAYSPIADSKTSYPSWGSTSTCGGIVGINNTYSKRLKSSSSLIKKCIYGAVAPINNSVGIEIGQFSPIAGHSGGYLFRSWEGNTHMQLHVDGVSGASPLYTLEDNYYASGVNRNSISESNFHNEPSAEADRLGPFQNGRYPYGTIPLSSSDVSLLPFEEWGKSFSNIQYWSLPGTRPPYPVGLLNNMTFNYGFPTPEGSAYLFTGLVQTINNAGAGVVSYTPNNSIKIANNLRISLNYIPSSLLSGKTKITINLANITLSPNNADGNGQIFLRAPNGWKFAQSTPQPYKCTVVHSSGPSTYYWFCLVSNANKANDVIMIPQ